MKQRGTSSSHFSFLINGFCLLTKSEFTEESFLFLLSLIKFNSPGAGTKTQAIARKKATISLHSCLGGDQLHRYWDKVKSNSSSKVCCWFLVLADARLRTGLGLCGRTFRFCFVLQVSSAQHCPWKQKGKVILKYKSPFCIQPGAIKCPDFF